MRELTELEQRRVLGGCDANVENCKPKPKAKVQTPPLPLRQLRPSDQSDPADSRDRRQRGQ